MSIPKYILSICAHCRRTLRVRSAYLGRMVTCNHCDHQFLAREVPGNRRISSSGEWPPIEPEQAPAESWGTGPRPEVERLQDQVVALQQRLEWAESVEEQLESTRSENSRLTTTLEVLKTELFERVTEVDRLQRSAEDLITVRAERDQYAEQLEAARRELEEQSQSFRCRIDVLEEGLTDIRAERDRALGHVARLEAELDRCAEGESQWERTLGENECRHRTEIDDLAHELRIASTQAGLAVQRERSFGEQRLEDQRHTHQEESTLLACELEAMFRQQLEEACLLRTTLQEQVALLQQQRDDAMEQVDMLRLDRDGLYGSLARLEARVLELEAENRNMILQPAPEAAGGQPEPEAATHPELELHTELDVLETLVDFEVDHSGAAASPAEAEQAALVPADALTGTVPGDSPGPEESDPDNDRIAPPEPLAAESPEARILHLRKTLRLAHEARSKGPLSAPFFARLARIWKRSGSAK